MSYRYRFFVVQLLVLFTVGCSSGGSNDTSANQPAQKTISSIAITPSNPTLFVGETISIGVLVTFEDNSNEIVTEDIVWTNPAHLVLTIDEVSGELTGNREGYPDISASYRGFTASTTVTVNPVLTNIEIWPTAMYLPVGFTDAFTATGHYIGGQDRDLTEAVTWTLSNTQIASVNANSGVVTSTIQPGTGAISAQLGNIVASGTLTVTHEKLVDRDGLPFNRGNLTYPFSDINDNGEIFSVWRVMPGNLSGLPNEVAQISYNPQTGWSTLTQAGNLPENGNVIDNMTAINNVGGKVIVWSGLTDIHAINVHPNENGAVHTIPGSTIDTYSRKIYITDIVDDGSAIALWEPRYFSVYNPQSRTWSTAQEMTSGSVRAYDKNHHGEIAVVTWANDDPLIPDEGYYVRLYQRQADGSYRWNDPHFVLSLADRDVFPPQTAIALNDNGEAIVIVNKFNTVSQITYAYYSPDTGWQDTSTFPVPTVLSISDIQVELSNNNQGALIWNDSQSSESYFSRFNYEIVDGWSNAEIIARTDYMDDLVKTKPLMNAEGQIMLVWESLTAVTSQIYDPLLGMLSPQPLNIISNVGYHNETWQFVQSSQGDWVVSWQAACTIPAPEGFYFSDCNFIDPSFEF